MAWLIGNYLAFTTSTGRIQVSREGGAGGRGELNLPPFPSQVNQDSEVKRES